MGICMTMQWLATLSQFQGTATPKWAWFCRQNVVSLVELTIGTIGWVGRQNLVYSKGMQKNLTWQKSTKNADPEINEIRPELKG